MRRTTIGRRGLAHRFAMVAAFVGCVDVGAQGAAWFGGGGYDGFDEDRIAGPPDYPRVHNREGATNQAFGGFGDTALFEPLTREIAVTPDLFYYYRFFATNGADRVSDGASYWGILELSGNLFERPVWAYGTGAGFAGTHGAGSVTLPADWPEPTGTPGFARGGAINTTALEVSTRNGGVYTHAGRNGYYGEGGFRCVRTAP